MALLLQDVDVEFDFESIVRESILPQIAETPAFSNTFGLGSFGRVDPKLRTVVCTYWLLGLCQKGNNCAYLHKFDKSKMPHCKHGKQCKIKNCPLKHEEEEERAECIFYRQGFCMHGPLCKFRHIKRPPDECPPVATFDQYVASGNVPLSKKRKTHQPNQFYKITLCKHWLEHGVCDFGEECHYAHGESDLRSVATTAGDDDDSSHKGGKDDYGDNVYDPFKGRMDAVMNLPYNSTTKAAYFLVHAPDLDTLRRSYVSGFWGSSVRIANEINDAVRTYEWVILYFMVRGLKAVYGVACVPGPIQVFPSPVSPLLIEFPVKWMRLLRMSNRMLSHLKMVSGGSQNIGRSIYDGRIDKNAGYEILLIAYLKPEWDWTLEIPRASCVLNSSTGQLVTVQPPTPPPPDPDRMLFSLPWIEMAFGGPQGSGGGDMRGGRGGSGRGMGGRGGGRGERGMGGPPLLQGGPEGAGPPADYYGGDLNGYIVNCTPQTMEEAMARCSFGLPTAALGETERNIRGGTPLFVQDMQTGVMHGLFEATGSPVEDKSKAPLSVQVPFRVVLPAPTLSMQDPQLLQIVGGRAPPDRIGALPLRQTKAVANVFASRAGVWQPGPAGGGRRGGAPDNMMRGGPPGSDRGGRGGGHREGANAVYRPPFRFNRTVPVDIPFSGDGFHLRKRLLGPQASRVHAITNEFEAHTPSGQQNVKIRLRGVGSGFLEGNREELQEPLHFAVSASHDAILGPACERVYELVQSVREDGQRGERL